MKKMTMKKTGLLKTVLFFVVCAAVFLFVPHKSVLNKYMMKVVNDSLIYFIAVLGLSVMLGMGGQVTFSTAGIMGIGAYITAILTTTYQWDTLPALLAAIVIGGIFTYIFGLALFRLKGSYFAFASIGLNQLLYTLMSNWMEVTGGPDGISKIPKLDCYIFQCTNYYEYFRLLFAIAVISYLVVNRMRKSYFGRALACVRDNEIVAQCMGINPYRTHVYSFVVAGVFACLAGSLYALHANYISPEPFKYDQSAVYLIMVMLGGVNSTFGALVGTMILSILPEKMRFLQEYYKLIYGVGIIFLMIGMPMGIMGTIESAYKKFRKKMKNKFKKGVTVRG